MRPHLKHQYRRVDLELNSLKLALIEVDKFVPPPELEATAAAIKATALSCKLPLREFLESVKGYERSLGVGQTAGVIKDVERKIRWATKEEAVTKLRGELAGYVGSVNMLLSLYQMKSLSTPRTMQHAGEYTASLKSLRIENTGSR